ncbi:MAG: transposase, partial [bacterium]
NCSGRVYSAKTKKFRKSLRLKQYDYRNNGAYFVTICTNFKNRYIGEKEKNIIWADLYALQTRFSGVKIDIVSIMPDHLHFIIFLSESQVVLPRIIQAFKSLTTLHLKQAGFKSDVYWQKNYYEHIIRNEKALQKIREYIKYNPLVEKIRLEEIYDG